MGMGALRAWPAAVVVLVPLLLRPTRALHPAVWVLCASTAAVYLTHPAMPPLRQLWRAPGERRSGAWCLASTNLTALAGVVDFSLQERVAEPGSPSFVAGAALVAWGLWERTRAVKALGGRFTSSLQFPRGQELITSGPYRRVRHPGYLGVLLGFFGTALLLDSVACLLLTLLLVVPAYLFRIHVEEAVLRAGAGRAFTEYARRTARLLPFLW